jgi:hypothetical protein
MLFFHKTNKSAAARILSEGFVDHTDTYGTYIRLTGVWLADVPLGAPEGAIGDTLLTVDICCAEDELADFEVVEESARTYREWCVPAALIKAKGSIRPATEEEEAVGDDERFERGRRILAGLGEGMPEAFE